jgi:phage terminase large subunit-like protein
LPKLPDYISAAIKCGHIPPDLEGWKTKPTNKLTAGERVLRFAKEYLVFPEGNMAGKPLILDPFQCAFILSAFDSKKHTRKAILSMARRGGKTLLMAVILLSYVVGSMAKQNTLIRSAAMTREQAGLLYRLMALILAMSPKLDGMYKVIPSGKKIVGLRKNVEYQSLSRDAKSGHGQAIYVLVVDECGQIDAPNDDFLDMLFSSMGTYEDARTFLISTQAPSDSAFFSVEMDTAERETPDGICCHKYAAETEDMFDEANWYAANPSLYGGYRSKEDIKKNAEEAARIPAKQNGFLNLFLNRRVAMEHAFLAPKVWKENGALPDLEVFKRGGVTLGLDLSMVNDLSAAVVAAKDDENNIHLLCYAFTPLDGIKERSARDKMPLEAWAKDGVINAFYGRVVDYDMLCQFLRDDLADKGITIDSVQFDRWKIQSFKSAAERQGFAQEAVWVEVGQGFKDYSPRVDSFEKALLENRIRHGMHPILNMGAASAVVISDPTGARKIDKTKIIGGGKIDGLVAAIMAVHPHVAMNDKPIDISAWIA